MDSNAFIRISFSLYFFDFIHQVAYYVRFIHGLHYMNLLFAILILFLSICVEPTQPSNRSLYDIITGIAHLTIHSTIIHPLMRVQTLSIRSHTASESTILRCRNLRRWTVAASLLLHINSATRAKGKNRCSLVESRHSLIWRRIEQTGEFCLLHLL